MYSTPVHHIEESLDDVAKELRGANDTRAIAYCAPDEVRKYACGQLGRWLLLEDGLCTDCPCGDCSLGATGQCCECGLHNGRLEGSLTQLYALA